ncbi:type I-MYXAN CRISPR-associated Cas8a1/Cmx1 [Tychonema sp. BBK16]|uniref:type I-MYXAN CRISPR-associated Cas8a1/Cmx1 n=1 Tax=Tychonema sp. BBK16 TaxID=2699888 RepID=UPI0038D31A17
MALTYQLTDPNFTIYHRAALGGLAATIHAWDGNFPEGIQAKFESDFLKITWDETLTEQEALSRILAASFKLTEDKLIELPGQFIGEDRADLRLAVHDGLSHTFLQHNKMRPGEKDPRLFPLRVEGEENSQPITYKAINSYAHQKAQGTGLLDIVKKGEAGKFPLIATIPQSVIPGAMTGKKALQSSAKEVILLLYLMVGSVVFLLRPRTHKEKAQYCIIVPDVTDLLEFADSMQSLTSSTQNFQRFSNTYLGRVVGGAEEAALSFLIDMSANSIEGCQAIAMGKVAWDKNQINRSITIKVGGKYPEINVFRAAKQYLGRSKRITSSGKSFVIPSSPLPELIAANLASERHWCAQFKDLVAKKEDFKNILFQRDGMNKMVKEIKNQTDQIIIRAFHKAWEMTMGQLGDRARDNNLDFNRLVEVRREKIRNEILRLKTSDSIANWFLQFCANATKGNRLPLSREELETIREFIFNSRNAEKLQNLLLFALISYVSDKPKAQD